MNFMKDIFPYLFGGLIVGLGLGFVAGIIYAERDYQKQDELIKTNDE